MRRLKLTKLAWISVERLRKEQFTHLLGTEVGKRVFDEKFFERLRAKLSDLERTMWKVEVSNIILLVALFVNAFVLPTGFRYGGIEAGDIGKLKELLLFASATLMFLTAAMSLDKTYMEMLATQWMVTRYGKEASDYMRTLVGHLLSSAPVFSVSGRPYQLRTAIHTVFTGMYLALSALMFIGILLGTLSVYVVVITDVIQKPSLPSYLTWPIVVYACASFAWRFLVFTWFYIPLPFRDYSLVWELEELSKKDPPAYQQRMREIVREARKRGG